MSSCVSKCPRINPQEKLAFALRLNRKLVCVGRATLLPYRPPTLPPRGPSRLRAALRGGCNYTPTGMSALLMSQTGIVLFICYNAVR